jgi:SAM-dependent methyltransferase
MTSDAERFFDAIAGRYDREYALPSGLSRDRMRRILLELPPAPARVLDLGVGTGRELSALLDAGHHPTGLDVSSAMLDRCRRRARPVPLVRADFWAPLPIPDASFDAVVALHGTLAHPPADGSLRALGHELARVTDPAGIFVAEVPAPAWLDRLERLPAAADRALRRTGPLTCTFEDHVAGATIEARVLTADAWTVALGPAWTTRVEASGELEWLVLARRTR